MGERGGGCEARGRQRVCVCEMGAGTEKVGILGKGRIMIMLDFVCCAPRTHAGCLPRSPLGTRCNTKSSGSTPATTHVHAVREIRKRTKYYQVRILHRTQRTRRGPEPEGTHHASQLVKGGLPFTFRGHRRSSHRDGGAWSVHRAMRLGWGRRDEACRLRYQRCATIRSVDGPAPSLFSTFRMSCAVAQRTPREVHHGRRKF